LAAFTINIAESNFRHTQDVAEEETLRPLLGTLKALNPGAVISGAAMGSGMSLPDFEHETACCCPNYREMPPLRLRRPPSTSTKP
jgi:hypothetical protein